MVVKLNIKILFFAFLIISTIFGFSGCSIFHTHEWLPATFTTPETCSSCGEQNGTAKINGRWRDRVEENTQYEFIISMETGSVDVDCIETDINYKYTLFNDMKITEVGDDYICAGGWTFTHKTDNTLIINPSEGFSGNILTRQ